MPVAWHPGTFACTLEQRELELKTAQNKYDTFLKELEVGDSLTLSPSTEALLTLLERTKEYLTAQPETDACPVCERAWQDNQIVTTLCEEIKRRLSDMEQVRQKI